ncbi:MAG: hypothetical protein JWO06_2471 [Bacteroidota bacterium]|nr:hypothetical protein [Bacteroidota bacterium]
MKKLIFCLVAMLGLCVSSFCQNNTNGKSQKPVGPPVHSTDPGLSFPRRDVANERFRAAMTLKNLKSGAVIVRLKTNQKSIDAYRKNGLTELADKIEGERKKLNENLRSSFVDYFTFCKVYFIYASETQAFLDGKKDVFLNAKLQHDPSIVLTDTFFVFCEYGSAMPYAKFSDNSNGNPELDLTKSTAPAPTQTTTDPSSSSSLVFYDKDLHQFSRPFPYSEGVYLTNFNAAVRTLDKDVERAYYKLVLNQEMKDSIKKMKDKPK